MVRPSVAVAWFVAFAALALVEQPGWRARIADGDAAAARAFAHEVRRCYPFVPVLAARARRAQDVLGQPVRRGGLVVLDVHRHHPRARGLAQTPDRFDPARFLGPVEEEALVPQGGGDVRTGHRCPGEGVTLTLLEVAVRRLAAAPWTPVPGQDLGWSTPRMPTRPRAACGCARAGPEPPARERRAGGQSSSAATARRRALSRPGFQTSLWVPSQSGIIPLDPHRQSAMVRRRRGSGSPSAPTTSTSPRSSMGPSG